ncbi:MAG: hypothetical protein EX341_03145 [Candidatus Scalindua sp. SCAELEC01]|nr:hypothetical protein [Planctomycetota bacterium]RZV95340.1 MAG: hypothetical protein EX341_03145 [Candidatus Scalindua sp. SCAELEC01]
MHCRLKNWIVFLSILTLLSSEVLLNKSDNVSMENVNVNLAAHTQLCCCDNDITACAECCCSTRDSGQSNKIDIPRIVSRNCNQAYGSLSQKIDYCVAAISFVTHFPFTNFVKSTVVILKKSPSTQLYKPPKV